MNRSNRLSAAVFLIILVFLQGGGTAAQSSRKGVGTWYFSGTKTAMKDISASASWFYSWRSTPNWSYHPENMEFVPMIWGASNVGTVDLMNAQSWPCGIILGFNEPDLSEHANVSVSEALALWPELENTGCRLGSPATAGDPSASGSWLRRFVNGSDGYIPKVDFICVHWYGTNFTTDEAVDELRSFLQRVHETFNKPIWLTEYGLMQYYPSPSYPSYEVQADFVAASTAMLESLDCVERYAWFCLPPWSWGGTTPTLNLYNEDGSATAPGVAYRGSGPDVPPDAPVLCSPTDGASGVSAPLTLFWNSVPEADSYRVHVSTSPDFSAPTLDESGINDTSCTIEAPDPGVTFYWRVNAANHAGTGDWSPVWSFTTVPRNQPPTVTIEAPATAEVNSTVELIATVTDDGLPSGEIDLLWRISKGAIGIMLKDSTSDTIHVSFASEGEYTARVTASDGERVASDEVPIAATPPENQPPVIDSVIVSNTEVYVGDTVYLSARGHDPDKEPLRWSWMSASSDIGTGPELAYLSPRTSTGRDTLTVLLSDQRGLSDDTTVVLSILEHPVSSRGPHRRALPSRIDMKAFPAADGRIRLVCTLPPGVQTAGSGEISITLFDMNGAAVHTLSLPRSHAGPHTLQVRPHTGSGVYACRLRAGNIRLVRLVEVP